MDSVWSWFTTQIHHWIQVATPILQHYGLWALALVLFTESAGVIFAPGESLIVAAAALSAKGVFSPYLAAPVAFSAAVLGGFLAYALGARYGHRALLRFGPYVVVKPELVDRGHRFFSRYGSLVVLFGRFVVPLRQLQGYLAGSAEMPFPLFAIWSAVGTVLWIAVWGGTTFFWVRYAIH